jgi:hypothetical protein
LRDSLRWQVWVGRCMTNTNEVSHNEIYERLCLVETKINALSSETADLLAAFHAAQGAFTVLEWVAKIAKPILYLGGLIAAAAVAWQHKT